MVVLEPCTAITGLCDWGTLHARHALCQLRYVAAPNVCTFYIWLEKAMDDIGFLAKFPGYYALARNNL